MRRPNPATGPCVFMMMYVDPNITYPPTTATAVIMEKGESQSKTPPVYLPVVIVTPHSSPPNANP